MEGIETILKEELKFLERHKYSAISISTTAKDATSFKVLPRRMYLNNAMSSFMVNDVHLLKSLIKFFDGVVQKIYVDTERKQELNIFKNAKQLISKSTLVALKPNDTTLESTDLLIRNYFNDDLYNKKVIIIGSGNLSSKLAVRLAERQATVYIKGRSQSKEKRITDSLNLFLPKYTDPIKPYKTFPSHKKSDLIVSFLSGKFLEEKILYPIIHDETLIIDGGINNFSETFIKHMLQERISIVRLDTRIAFPYQLLSSDEYIQDFFSDVFGLSNSNGIPIASGGFIGAEGTIIVNSIKNPDQIIGIADGNGGVKTNEQLTSEDRRRIQTVKENLS